MAPLKKDRRSETEKMPSGLIRLWHVSLPNLFLSPEMGWSLAVTLSGAEPGTRYKCIKVY